VDPILARIMGGETLEAICARRGMPSVASVYNWLRRHPEFLERYRNAKAIAPDIMAQDACDRLRWVGERASWVLLRRTVRESDKRAARLTLKRHAPWTGPAEVTVAVVEPDGRRRVIYGDPGPPGSAPASGPPAEFDVAGLAPNGPPVS
jgi:hypothetical protein